MKRIWVTCAIAIIVSDMTCATAWAQVTAQISGAVKDQSGAILPGVEIRVTQTDTGTSRDTVTNESGFYILTNLPIGPYRLEASLPGFRTFAQTGIVLEVKASPTLNVVMEVGQVTEQVEVQANATQVETRNAGVGTVMENASILELPLNGRNMIDLVSLSGATNPALAISGSGGLDPFSQGNVSVAGGLNGGLNYTLDGATHNNPFDNSYLSMPFPDALQEFKVETGATGAQTGVKGAGTVSLVTKQGTNQFHGDAFEFVRNGAFNARNAFAVKRDSIKRNQFGGTLGGPILTNRVFFFGGYQGTTFRQAPSDQISLVPTAAMLVGDFTAYTSPACNAGQQITLKAPFVNNRIDPSLLSPAALTLTKTMNIPSADPCGRIKWGIPGSTNDYQGIMRIDYQRSASHSIFGRYFADQINIASPFDLGGYPLNALGTGKTGLAQAFTLGDTYLFGANIVNAFRLTANRISGAKLAAAYDNAGLGTADIGVHAFAYYPHRPAAGGVSGAFNFASTGGAGNGYTDTTIFGANDDISALRGNHQLTFGTQVAAWKAAAWNNTDSTMNINFTGQATGSAMADFFVGSVAVFQNGTDFTYPLASKYVGVYAGDIWRLNPKLTVNYGIRWEPYFPMIHTDKDVFHFDPNLLAQGIKSNQFPTTPAGVVFPGDPGFPGFSGMYTKWRNFAPRLGLAWDVGGDGRTAVRASSAIFYDFPQLEMEWMFGAGPPFTPVYVLNGVNYDNPWATRPGGDPLPAFHGRDIWNHPSSAEWPTYATIPAKDYNNPNMRVFQWNLGIQRQVATNWVVSATYLGNATRHLWTDQSINPAVFLGLGSCTINGVSYATCSTTANTNQRRVLSLANPASGQYYGTVQKIGAGGTASYNGLLLAVQRHAARGVTLDGNYTWSHCISDPILPETGASTGFSGYSDPNNRRFDRGNCNAGSADLRQVLKLDAVIDAPQFSNRGVRAVASGWRISPIFKAFTGNQLNITTGQDTALNGGLTTERGNQILGNPYGSKTPDNYLNPAAFHLPALGTLGNIGVGSIAGPGSWNIDTALSRIFQLREAQKVELRFEAFNLLNHFRMMDPTTALNSPLFGKVIAAKDPRIMQFALKYVF
jgi:hypothetical protein